MMIGDFKKILNSFYNKNMELFINKMFFHRLLFVET